MGKKFTFSQVKQMFKAAGFELLSTNYTSSKEPLAFRCKRCGHRGTTRLEYIKAGMGCSDCWEARRGQNQKHSLDFVREKFAAKRLELFSKAYPNSKTPLSYRCVECGYVGRLRFNDLSNGSGCRQCGIRRRTSLQKLDLAAFKNHMRKRGIEVLTRDYVNSETPLELRCMKCRRLWEARPYDVRHAKVGCPRCGHKKGGQSRAYTHEQVARASAKLQITLLERYQRSQQPMRVRFERCGHSVQRSWNEIQREIGCPKCAANARTTSKHYHAVATQFGGELLEVARTTSRPARWRCSLGHEFPRSLASIRKLGTFCTVCSGSYAEMLCRACVEKLFFGKKFMQKRIPGMRSPKDRPLELDIYNEDLRIAVEHHGAHHYRALPHWGGKDGFRVRRLHDRLRRQYCRASEILLVEIRELGDRTTLEELRQQIRAALLKAGQKLPARFDRVKLTNLPHVNKSEVYWNEIQGAARAMGLKILSREFFGSAKPLSVECPRGHITAKTPRSILEGHKCDKCDMEQRKKPLRFSDGRVFESGAAAAKFLDITKEVINKAVRHGRTLDGLRVERISWDEFRHAHNKERKQLQ